MRSGPAVTNQSRLYPKTGPYPSGVGADRRRGITGSGPRTLVSCLSAFIDMADVFAGRGFLMPWHATWPFPSGGKRKAQDMRATPILPAVLMAFGIIAMADGLRSGLGTVSMPGSGGWPLAVGAMLTLSSLVLLPARGASAPDGLDLRLWVQLSGAVVLFALTYGLGGLMLAAAASAGLASRAFPGRGQVWIVPAAALAALGLWLALSYAMHMPVRLLPIGLGV